MKVFIAEKPRVAEMISDALGGGEPMEGFYQVGEDRVSWALGHLFELARPEDYQKSWKRWRADDLPLLPDPLRIRPLARHRKQLAVLRSLLEDADEIINACDAGREGELIFAWILDKQKKSIQKKYHRRLWLSSLQPEAIREGVENLRPAGDLENLLSAARARAEADWILGINATRAATLSLQTGTVSLGRVQTPTLALLVQRDKERANFTEETFWTVGAEFATKEGTYVGEHENGRMTKKEAERICSQTGKTAKVLSVKEKEKREPPPRLYDLTALQRDASSRFGWPAARTLRVAQALYEEERVLSYPRTDSSALPEDTPIEPLRKFLPEHRLRDDLGRVLDDSRVSDHHAIVPVANGSGLRGDRKKLFQMVCQRTAEALSPDALFLQVTIKTETGGEIFITSGRFYSAPGWRELRGSLEQLPKISRGDQVRVLGVRAAEGKTKPPPRYSDGTLLGAMETAGQKIDDEEAREAMKELGLGTPATRAAIIERLIEVGYAEREGKALLATDKGHAVVGALGKSELLRADLTGQWERSLREIERGASAEDFRERLREWVSAETKVLLSLEAAAPGEWGKCPGCGRPLRENRAAVSCWSPAEKGCGFALWKKVAGKTLSQKALRELLEKGQTGPLRGFRSRSGKKFSASLRLQKKGDEWEVFFD